MQVREKVEKSRNTVFFQCFGAPEGWKVGSLERRVRSHLGRWWEMRDEKLHAVVARSTFASKSAQNKPTSEHCWKITCSKSARRCAAKHISKSKVKNGRVRSTFRRSDVVLRGRRKGLCTLSKMSKMWGFCSSFKSLGRRGTFEEDLQTCISRGRRNTRDMFIRDVRRSGRWFPEKGYILDHQIVRFAKMILGDGCSTSYDLASLFRGRRNTLGGVEKLQNALVEAVSSAVNFPFSFLTLSS